MVSGISTETGCSFLNTPSDLTVSDQLTVFVKQAVIRLPSPYKDAFDDMA